MLPAAAKAPKLFTGWHMLVIIVSFFAVVIGVNITMAIIAARSWTGLVVPNSYVASQEFQGRLDAVRAQQALGWAPDLTYIPGAVTLTIKDGKGVPIDLGAVTLAIQHPIGEKYDQTVEMLRQPDGTYRADLTIAPGIWNAVATAEQTSAGRFELDKRLTLEATAK